MAHQFYFSSYILDNLPAPKTGFDVVQDITEPRLRMYVTSRGAKTFFVRKRVHGKDKRIVIGNYPDIDIDMARAAVQKTLDQAMKKKPTRRRKISFKQFVDLYLENKVKRSEDSYVKLVRAINKHLVDLFGKNINEISGDDVRSVITKISGNAIAVRMQELLASIFNYAIDMGYVKNNPVQGLEKIQQKRRVRTLNKTGFKKLMKAIAQEENIVYQSAFYMLVYAFAPRSKVFAMSWDDLDFNHFMWKDKPLSDRACVLLQDLSQDGQWVFPGYGGTHIIDPRLAWKRVVKNAGMPNLTMDDVYKFLTRQLVWAPDKEDLRTNFNELLDDLLMDEEY